MILSVEFAFDFNAKIHACIIMLVSMNTTCTGTSASKSSCKTDFYDYFKTDEPTNSSMGTGRSRREDVHMKQNRYFPLWVEKKNSIYKC